MQTCRNQPSWRPAAAGRRLCGSSQCTRRSSDLLLAHMRSTALGGASLARGRPTRGARTKHPPAQRACTTPPSAAACSHRHRGSRTSRGAASGMGGCRQTSCCPGWLLTGKQGKRIGWVRWWGGAGWGGVGLGGIGLKSPLLGRRVRAKTQARGSFCKRSDYPSHVFG